MCINTTVTSTCRCRATPQHNTCDAKPTPRRGPRGRETPDAIETHHTRRRCVTAHLVHPRCLFPPSDSILNVHIFYSLTLFRLSYISIYYYVCICADTSCSSGAYPYTCACYSCCGHSLHDVCFMNSYQCLPIANMDVDVSDM